MTNGETPTLLSLTEYLPACFPQDVIPHGAGELLWRSYGKEVEVDFPSPKTEGRWQLTSKGTVGYIPLGPELGLLLQPKVELDNLFRMLEYGYRLESFRFLDGLVACGSLQEFYERLANVLAKRVLLRARRGLYREYVPEADRLPYVRGRLDVGRLIRSPWKVRLPCSYEEHTADVDDNQILAWTLTRIARSGLCTERVLPRVRRAYRALRGFASTEHCMPRDCVGRLYSRLNDDYHPMHALCRFFLEHTGPTHHLGDRSVLPFLVNMERLYELFVAEWLKAHLPERLLLKVQEKVRIGEGDVLTFSIDLVLYDVAETENAVCVLDTKYKVSDRLEHGDVFQAVAYADMKGCDQAVLIYPTALSEPADVRVRDVRLRSMAFVLEGDLEQRGREFMWGLLEAIGYHDLVQIEAEP